MNQQTNRIVREEFGRTAAWLFFSLLGWSLILNSTPELDMALPTFLGATFATAAGMSLVVITVRLRTGRELKGGRELKDLVLLTTLYLVSIYLLWAHLSANWTTVTSVLVMASVATVVIRIVRPSVFGILPTKH
ncbi:hypothetical protein [Haladaptatus sp. DFWS20]|uniref:hypothetical protein n=1 Tax=Haladaptatus sp. DFWS20 TaxID=3403467 RepID=UPI003EC0F05E